MKERGGNQGLPCRRGRLHSRKVVETGKRAEKERGGGVKGNYLQHGREKGHICP